ncbi:MAG: hypothetical protein K2L82_01780 [Lachnospiraceae bacterium]|nr:hypothetical protein [Lachnospiraceae bacterium]
MFTTFFQHRNFIAVILALLFASIICQIVMGVIYHRFIWETEHMSSTTNKSLQQLKLKFSGCCKINERVSNVSVFVDRFISHMKFGIMPLSMLKHLSGQLMLLSVLVAGIGACLSIIHNENFLSIAPFYIISFLGLYCYFAVSSLIDVPGKINILRINLVDYLENHLANRLEQTELDMKLVQPEAEENRDKHHHETAALSDSSGTISGSEMEELELLLQEFLLQ